MTQVWHYDGASGIRHEPELVPTADGFRLRLDAGLGDHHDWSDLISLDNQGTGRVFGLKDRRGWRIGFDGEINPEVARHLPSGARYGRLIDRIGLWPATGAFAALSALALFIAVKTPDWLAPMVPMSLEAKLGDAMVGDFGGRVCKGTGGQAGLDAMVRRIEPNAEGLKVRTVNIAMVNAVALPGGNIFIFRGLLQEAKSPDELAGVIGHEIGHVRNRDVMQALLRQMGLSVLLGGMNGDVGGGINTLLSSSYGRDAEARADQYAIKAMQRSSVSPDGTAGFFARLAEAEKALGKGAAALGYIASHPVSSSREKAFRASKVAGKPYTPVVTAEQWRAIIDSCANDPHVDKNDNLLF